MKVFRTLHKRLTFPQLLRKKADEWTVKRLERRAHAYASARRGPMAVFANDAIGIRINQYGVFDGEDIALLLSLLAPLQHEMKAGTAIDIGANIGNHALAFADHFALVVCFEPNPDVFDILRFNTRLVPNIRPIRLGLGDDRRRAELYQNATNIGASSICGDPQSGRSVTIDIERLDDLDVGSNPVRLIKIDVEGYEDRVLRGALATIRRDQPAIVLEQHRDAFTDGASASVELLTALDYVFIWRRDKVRPALWFYRFANVLKWLIAGKTVESELVVSDTVPAGTYFSLLAIPRAKAHLIAR